MDARLAHGLESTRSRGECRSHCTKLAAGTVVGGLVALVLASGAPSASATVVTAAGDPAPAAGYTGRVIVGLRPGLTASGTPAAIASRVAALAATVGGTTATALALGTASVITLPAGANPTTAANALATRTDVAFAEPERVVTATGSWTTPPADPLYSTLWDLAATPTGINAPGAWTTTTGTGTTVAVIDTGIANHPELTGRILPGANFVGKDCTGSASTTDENGHGTHVAGTIAAAGNNGQGIVGVAPDTTLLPVKVLNCRGGGTNTAVAQGIAWAAGGGGSTNLPVNPAPAKVINLSLGGAYPCSTLEQTAIDFARSKGATVVVAAGNDSQNVSTSSPANCKNVITIASTSKTGSRSAFSNFGTLIALSAPGETITSLKPPTGYTTMSGTSMATPHAAAVAALLYSIVPTLTPDQVRTYLTTSTHPFPTNCTGCGTGILDAKAAIAALTTTLTPTVTGTNGATSSGPAGPAGPLTGGTQLQLTGKNLAGVGTVTFGGTPGTVLSRTDTTLTVTAPPRPAAGTVPVVLTATTNTVTLSTDKQGTTPLTFTYLPKPTVTKLSSSGGSRNGGQTITLTGTAFQSVQAVSVGDRSVPFTVSNSTGLSFVTPKAMSPGKVPITVTTPGGSSITSAATTYTYN